MTTTANKEVHWQDGVGSERKRNRRSLAIDESAFDDIMGQSKLPSTPQLTTHHFHLPNPVCCLDIVTVKLNSLSTKDNEYRDSSIAAFMEVLRCPNTDAEFYLESSNWDVQTAVVLWLENNPNRNVLGHNLFFPSASSALESSSTRSYGSSSAAIPAVFGKPITKKYQRKDVEIEGINPPWVARVSAFEGVMYFHNLQTGQSQRQVPPGFADLPTDEDITTELQAEGENMTLEESEEVHGASSSSNNAPSSSSKEHRGPSRSTSPFSMEHSTTTTTSYFRDHNLSPAFACALPTSEQGFMQTISTIDGVPSSKMPMWRPTPAEEALCAVQGHTQDDEEEEEPEELDDL